MSKKIKRIPILNSVKVNSKITYEVLFADEIISGPDVLGEMRPNEKQIVLKNGQSERELQLTFLHENFHLMADENNLKLTEKQVRGLEKAFYKWLVTNDLAIVQI